MMELINRIIMISLLYLIDMSCTFFIATTYRSIFPQDKNWTEMELNFILRNLWKKYGLKKGTLFASLIVYPLVFLIAFFIIDDFFFGFLIGLYSMLFLIHITTIRQLLIAQKKYEKKK